MSHNDYLEPYRETARSVGSDFQVTLWASRESQVRRFRVMTQMVDFTGKRLLDAGCSRGDFAAYLIEQDIAFAHFYGLDGLAEVIDFAAARNLPRCTFQAGDFLTDPGLMKLGDPQVITISGSLNTMNAKQMMTVLEAAWRATSQTLIFNILSDLVHPRGPRQLPPARRHDTLALLKWASKHSSQIQMRQDYFPFGHDATISMSKD